MQIERLSIKTLTLWLLALVGVLAVGSSLIVDHYYRETAQAELRAGARARLELAVRAAQQHMEEGARQLAVAAARAFARQPGLTGYLAEAPPDTHNPVLAKLLEAPLDNDLASARPVAAQLYNAAGQRLMSSGQELQGAPPFLDRAEAGQATGGYWHDGGHAWYSLAQPLGNSKGRGHLVLHFDPVATLQQVAALTARPLRILSPAGDTLFESADWAAQASQGIEVRTSFDGGGNDSLLGLVLREDDRALNQALADDRAGALATATALTLVVLLLAFGLFNRFLFTPLQKLTREVEQLAQGAENLEIDIQGSAELQLLGRTVNEMNHRMQEIVERERQSAEDVKGKVELIQEVVAMAAEGDLTGEIMVYRDQDIISELAEGIARMLDNLNSLVARIQQAGVQVASSATEIAATARQQEATVTQQAATTHEIKSTVTRITDTSRDLVNTMKEVTEVAWKTSENANSGRASLSAMEQTMHKMMEATEAISSKLAVLSEKAGNINTVVTTINRVADQTNLLSLNAAIEAEKAGEYGMGFSVVATEIRRLADQTAVATWDIEQMVKEMQSAVSAGVMGMEKFSEEVRAGVGEVRQVGAQLASIIEQVGALIPRFEAVNEGMGSQAQGGRQICEAIAQLSESSQQTADSLRQSNGAIMQLNEAAQRLHEGASHFKVKNSASC